MFNSAFGGVSLRFVNGADMVPMLPPKVGFPLTVHWLLVQCMVSSELCMCMGMRSSVRHCRVSFLVEHCLASDMSLQSPG